MIQTYSTLKSVLGDKAARKIVEILVTEFHWYITFEEVQKLNLMF